MRPQGVRTVGLVIAGAVVLALGTLVLAPALTRNMLFVAALPFVGILFIILVLNINTTFIFLLWTRSLMDHALEHTKAGGGFGLGALVNIFVIITVFLVAIRFPKVIQKNRYVIPWGVFLLVGMSTVPFAPDSVQAFRLMISLTTYLCMFLVPFFIVKTEKDKKFWVRMLLLSSFIPVGFANLGLVLRKYPFVEAGSMRLEGSFTHPNILAFYLAFVATVVFYVLKAGLFRMSGPKKIFLWLYMANVLVALIATQTRSAWLAVAILFLCYGIFKERKFLFVCLLGGLVLMATPQVQSRMKDLSEGTGVRSHEKLNSAAWRVKLWESAIPSIKKRFVLGYGLESFRPLSGGFFVLEPDGVPAHNVYVEL